MNPAAFLAMMALLPAHAPGDGPGGRHDDRDDRRDRRDERAVITCPANVVGAFDSLDNALRHLAMDVDAVKKGGAREALRRDVRAALAQSAEARLVACRETRHDVIVVQPPPPPVVIVLDEPRHRELVTVVRREAFDDGRLGVLELGMRDACLTSSQAKDLVQELTFSQARIDAVRVLAPRIVDRDRAHVILESLTFDSDRKKAREVLTVTTTAPQCVVRRL